LNTTEYRLVTIWGIVTLPVSKQKALRWKNGGFCYLGMEILFCIRFCWDLFNEFLRKMHHVIM